MSDTMSVTDMLSRLRADTADERFDGARLGPTAVRELLRHVDALAARLAEIETQQPVGVVEAGEWRTGFGDTSPAVWVKITQDGAGVSVPLGTVLHARPIPAAAPERSEPADGCGACGDACRSRGSCRLADESPECKA